ncbi:ATP-dependent RNA helicase HrpA [Candidatus Uabimicrobium sp. HlEnr_7]|uniref:ATP-dependent RNA helicase HrpA n=1 Tax=Candidatus Uabimicrobium helgolandensis TaxID=3095367 RepID=UPI0035588B00
MLSLESLSQQIKNCLPRDRYRLGKMLHSIKKNKRQNRNIENRLLEANIRIEESIALYEYRKENVPAITYPAGLPILEKKDEIIQTIRNHSVVVICGETGSGKTTQLPKMCVEAGCGISGKIGCTQPRRIAATSIAERIREELSTSNKETVSYKIRFTSSDSDKSYIKLMTDGILLAETQNDRFLMEYDTIIIDEAHERSLNIDFILGYLKQLLKKRPELKIIISSATIDTERFSKYFDDAPIIEVSGRLYPVEVMYLPLDKELEDSGEITLIDAAVQAVDLVVGSEESHGDILVFMAAEQDIRETVEKLQKWSQSYDILPLFGRLSSKEQNRVFRNSNLRKIIVSTNIAETSLTIPGIRYVVDSGCARISRYSPRTRTQRLPIEAISQSSANQRKGRCGRVADGVCIRLYSEEDFLSREKYTSPEIRRSNLAEVILRMISLKLGDIEIFPFIEPPSRTAILDGFDILGELGALDTRKMLTTLGRKMSRLPIDPRTSRMLIEAQQENSLREVLVIASALSIPDPRQRPVEKQEEADRMHQMFIDQHSDFVSFLNIWDKYQESWETLKTQNKVRKFCNKHFLSYPRMREWRDIHKQLASIMKQENSATVNEHPASYEATHKAILSGFLSNICSKKEKNNYLGRANKEYIIFPGSGQYSRGFAWIVAAELVETSQLFARTVAKIQPEWIEPLARDLCHYSYSNARWDLKGQQPVADKKVTLFGLVIVPQKRTYYGKINRKVSRDLFVQAIIDEEVYHPFSFLKANRKLIESVVQMENKIRKHTLLVEDEDLKEFYYQALPNVVDVRELRKFLRENPKYQKLYMKQSDILQIDDEPNINEELFPDYIMLGDLEMPLNYHFEPVDEKDGVTLSISRNLLHQLTPEPFEWLVPGMLEDKIHCLLRSLPKDTRRKMQPLADHAHRIYKGLPRSHNTLLSEIRKYIRNEFSLSIPKEEWRLDRLDLYLKMRFQIVDKNNNVLAIDRDLSSLQKRFQAKSQDDAWHKAARKWTLKNLSTWDFNELPESINVTEEMGDIPYLGYPGLQLTNKQVHRTLFRKLNIAEKATREATNFLLTTSLEKELKKLERLLKLSKELQGDMKHFSLSDNVKKESIDFLRNTLLHSDEVIRTREAFQEKSRNIIQTLPKITIEYIDLLEEIIDELDRIEEALYEGKFSKDYKATIHRDIKQLFPEKFLTFYILPQLQNHPRYLKCLQIRIEKATNDQSKDERKCEEILLHTVRYNELKVSAANSPNYIWRMIEEYRWMIEEFKISVFSQKLKTLYPISAKRLEKKRLGILKIIDES